MVYICSSSYWETEAGGASGIQSHSGQHRPVSLKKKKKSLGVPLFFKSLFLNFSN